MLQYSSLTPKGAASSDAPTCLSLVGHTECEAVGLWLIFLLFAVSGSHTIIMPYFRFQELTNYRITIRTRACKFTLLNNIYAYAFLGSSYICRSLQNNLEKLKPPIFHQIYKVIPLCII